MYAIEEKHDILNEAQLIEHLKNYEPIVPGGPVAIVGGHFMLMYDKYEDCLKPLIHQELQNPKHKEFAKLMAGDFPIKSFRYSMELIKHYRSKGIKAKNVFIVNDHKFQSRDFQPEILGLVKGRGGELRKKFYRQKNPIPNVFLNIIDEYGFDYKDVLYNNSKKGRQSNEILPINSYFFSEQALRTRFDKKIKPKLIKKEEFYFSNNDFLKTKNLYFSRNGNDICLTEQGKCDCSSEVLEFINNLISNNNKNIIFFVPSECNFSVNNGVNVASFLNAKYSNNFNNISVISGLGGMNMLQKVEKIEIKTHMAF